MSPLIYPILNSTILYKKSWLKDEPIHHTNKEFEFSYYSLGVLFSKNSNKFLVSS
jgi:hypothetical protein